MEERLKGLGDLRAGIHLVPPPQPPQVRRWPGAARVREPTVRSRVLRPKSLGTGTSWVSFQGLPVVLAAGGAARCGRSCSVWKEL